MNTGPSRNGLEVVVTGDVTVDWHLARVDDSLRPVTEVSYQPGGAALLGTLINDIAKNLNPEKKPAYTVSAPKIPKIVSPTDENLHHRHAIWKKYTTKEGGQAWRVDERLGIDRKRKCNNGNKSENMSDTAPMAGSSNPTLVVIHDASLGFRDNTESWPASIRELTAHKTPEENPPWVLLRMGAPVAEGKLWERLQEIASRLIVVVHIDELRLSEVDISKELSWERTAQDLLWEFMFNRRVEGLAKCAHLVVSFTTAGALVASVKSGTFRGIQQSLIFDPKVMERMWNEDHPGDMIGGLSTLAASIARQIMINPDDPDVISGVQHGISAMRWLDENGYAAAGTDGKTRLKFPTQRIIEELVAGREILANVHVPEPSRRRDISSEHGAGRSWAILEEKYNALPELAKRIVEYGWEKELKDVPIGEFGDFRTTDRYEIEGFRSISTLIREYSKQCSQKQPLSIAVFGPPGSGKSFGVRQVAKTAVPERIEEIEFNLSQYNNPDALIDSFHRVRDISLTGKLPLVFWDEFDSTLATEGGIVDRLGWLRYFLSPMQDGEFRDGQLTHPIGPAVFVFAGGTCDRMQDFTQPATHGFRAAKGTDFLSRIKGYVNVLGPNPRNGNQRSDPGFFIRRALILRSILFRCAPSISRQEGNGPKRLLIDPGVLRALLETGIYRHGMRSMESVIAMSALAGKSQFERSALPPEALLDLHVEADNFLDLVHQSDPAQPNPIMSASSPAQ